MSNDYSVHTGTDLYMLKYNTSYENDPGKFLYYLPKNINCIMVYIYYLNITHNILNGIFFHSFLLILSFLFMWLLEF